ncbi:MAG: type I-E CRISPR-associated protein Cas6/Cse3/CasE [Desulfuromonadaceae bacterium]|nr:type I-E CRISPR-associated protein Cas6/Cse3/CasE [Desulfuromonadaceae bacterium]MDD2847451.1 type I-E CRISPR-associated protein Cas6/Cse3/CasE [Desulfuromonadaceae bacterium]
MFFSRVRIRPDVRELHLLVSGNGYGAHQLLWKLFPGEEKRSFLFREEIAREQIPFRKGVKGEPVFYTVSESQPISDHPLFVVDSKQYAPKIANGERLAFRLRANPTVARKEEGKKNSPRHDVVMDAQYHLLREIAADMSISTNGKKLEIKKRIIEAWRQIPNSQKIEEKLRGIIDENERYVDVPTSILKPVELLDLAFKASMDKALETWFVGRCERLGFTMVRDGFNGHMKLQAEGYQWHALPKKGRDAGFSSVDFEGEVEVVDAGLFSKALFEGIGPAKGFGCGLMLVRRC